MRQSSTIRQRRQVYCLEVTSLNRLAVLLVDVPRMVEKEERLAMETAATRKPRTQPPEKRRDDLMNAAQKLFLEHGILATTIEQIALGAELSKGAFYLHFDSKDEIHLALCERFSLRFNDSVREAVAKVPKDDWRRKVTTWVRATVGGLLDEGDLVNMLFHSHPIPANTGWDDIVVAPLLDLLDAGAARGAWKLEDSRFTAIFLYSGLHGVIDDALMGERRTNRTRLMRGIETMCLTALGLAE